MIPNTYTQRGVLSSLFTMVTVYGTARRRSISAAAAWPTTNVSRGPSNHFEFD